MERRLLQFRINRVKSVYEGKKAVYYSFNVTGDDGYSFELLLDTSKATKVPEVDDIALVGIRQFKYKPIVECVDVISGK